jgi:hypothetical protein
LTTLAAKQPAVMAGIVTTLLWLPAGALLTAFCYGAFDVSLEAFLTLGHSLPHPSLGLVAWWVIGFAPAYVYVVLISTHD